MSTCSTRVIPGALKDAGLDDSLETDVVKLQDEFILSFPSKLRAKMDKYGLKKALGGFETSRQILWHIRLINEHRVALEQVSTVSQGQQSALCLSAESVGLAAFVFDCLDNWKVNMKVENASLLKVMDLILCIGSEFSVAADSLEYNRAFSKMVVEASELLFDVDNYRGQLAPADASRLFQLCYSSRVEHVINYLYASCFKLKASDQAVVESLASAHGRLFGLKRIFTHSEPFTTKAMRSKPYSAFIKGLAGGLDQAEIPKASEQLERLLKQVVKSQFHESVALP